MIIEIGIEGPFGWLRGGFAKPDGSVEECNLSESNDKCGNDIHPNMWYDPNRDLTQREVMKAIIGYGLRYTDPGRFGGPDECDDNSRCKYNYKKRSLLQNAYEHATGDSVHPNFKKYKPVYSGAYTAPTILFDNTPTIDARTKTVNGVGGYTCTGDLLDKPWFVYHCWSKPNLYYHKMLAYGVMGYLTEADREEGVYYKPNQATEPTEGKWTFKDKNDVPVIDHLMVDLIEHLCREYKNNDYEEGSVMIKIIN